MILPDLYLLLRRCSTFLGSIVIMLRGIPREDIVLRLTGTFNLRSTIERETMIVVEILTR